MKIIDELNENHIEQLHALYQDEWWSRGRSLEDTKKCVAGSQLCIGITSKTDELIGFARVLTDFTFKAFIFDVIIDQGHRGEGLGSQLLVLIRNHPRLQSVRHFELYCLPDLLPFYEKHGFSSELGEIKLIRAVNA